MTVLSFVAGFRLRTGWRLLSGAESVRLSAALRIAGGPPLIAIARHDGADGLACLDPCGRDLRKARVLILRGSGMDARPAEEHASLAAWLRALGLPAEPRRCGNS